MASELLPALKIAQRQGGQGWAVAARVGGVLLGTAEAAGPFEVAPGPGGGLPVKSLMPKDPRRKGVCRHPLPDFPCSPPQLTTLFFSFSGSLRGGREGIPPPPVSGTVTCPADPEFRAETEQGANFKKPNEDGGAVLSTGSPRLTTIRLRSIQSYDGTEKVTWGRSADLMQRCRIAVVKGSKTGRLGSWRALTTGCSVPWGGGECVTGFPFCDLPTSQVSGEASFT